jgi:predicted ester cyclase
MSETADLVRAHHRAFNDRDWSVASRIYSPDLLTAEPGSGAVRGIEAFVAHAQGFVTGFPDARLELLTLVDDGERVTTEGAFVGTNTGPLMTPQGELPPTGRSLRLLFCDVWESEAGRVTNHRMYYDQMSMAAQLGLLPEPANAV